MNIFSVIKLIIVSKSTGIYFRYCIFLIFMLRISLCLIFPVGRHGMASATM